MRSLRIVLTLMFGLAMVGPEAHACPIHDQGPTPTHHQHSSSQHQRAHCTCPQACCPAGVAVSLPATTASWTAVSQPLVVVEVPAARPLLLPSRKHLLPFALAPPHTLR